MPDVTRLNPGPGGAWQASPGVNPPLAVSRPLRPGAGKESARVDNAELAQARAKGAIVDAALADCQHLPGAFPRHLVQGQQLACVGFTRGFRGLARWRDVPQL